MFPDLSQNVLIPSSVYNSSIKVVITFFINVSGNANANCHSLNSTSTQVESDKVISWTTHTTTFMALPDNLGS